MEPVTTVGPPPGWVPVEQRWLGFDRRTIVPAVVVAAIAVLMAIVLPAINSATPNQDRVRSGDVLQTNLGVQFTPVPGWAVSSGLRAGQPAAGGSYPGDAVVDEGSVSFTVRVDRYAGAAPALLSKIRTTNNRLKLDGTLHVDDPTRSITTSTGLAGVISRYSGTRADGIIAAFATGSVGVEVAAVAGDGELDPQTVHDVAAMILSSRLAAGASR